MGRPAQGEVAQRGHAEVERPQVATVRKHRRGAGGREGLESGGDGRQQEHGLVGQTDSAKERSSVGAGQAAFHFLSAYLFAFAFIRGRKGGKTIIMWERGPNPSNSRGGGGETSCPRPSAPAGRSAGGFLILSIHAPAVCRIRCRSSVSYHQKISTTESHRLDHRLGPRVYSRHLSNASSIAIAEGARISNQHESLEHHHHPAGQDEAVLRAGREGRQGQQGVQVRRCTWGGGQ